MLPDTRRVRADTSAVRIPVDFPLARVLQHQGAMDAKRWVQAFEVNLQNRPEPEWAAACALSDEARVELGKSLSHFQLGESGGGSFLLRGANARAAAIADPAYPRALQMFIDEENEHARLLSKLCERYRVPLTQEHWTHFFFHHIRQVAGIDFELIVLVTAELIGNAYYETLVAHVTDVPLQQAARLILRDEAMHVEFHLDRLADAIGRRGRIGRQAFASSLTVLFEAALIAMWFDHRRGVTAAGATRSNSSRARANGATPSCTASAWSPPSPLPELAYRSGSP